jgi:transposase
MMTKSNQIYPTDLNDTEWKHIAPDLPKAKGKRRATRYRLARDYEWRALPHDLPAWQKVYYYFRLLQKEQHL